MTTTGPADPEILLVGSVPLKDTDDVIATVYSAMGAHLRRIPDGEIGERSNWIGWQYPRLLEHPALEIDRDARPYALATERGGAVAEIPLLRFRDGVDPHSVEIDTGYAEAAKSYVYFAGLKRMGRLRPDLRFQFALPTPLAVACHFISPAHQGAFAAAYERALIQDVHAIVHAIPHPELALQWDVAFEVFVWEGRCPHWAADGRAESIAALARLADAVPDAVEMGYHLCYGDPGGHHVIEPKDSGILVDIANAIASRITRPIQWLHMPVPADRKDDAYFAPLAGLALHPETRLVLGLVHDVDGEPGNAARIASARKYVPIFGLATECGWGRRPPASVPELMRLHVAAAAAMTC